MFLACPGQGRSYSLWDTFMGATSWWSDPSYNPAQRSLFITLLWPLYPEDLRMHSINTNAKDCQLYNRYPILATALLLPCQKQLMGEGLFGAQCLGILFITVRQGLASGVGSGLLTWPPQSGSKERTGSQIR